MAKTNPSVQKRLRERKKREKAQEKARRKADRLSQKEHEDHDKHRVVEQSDLDLGIEEFGEVEESGGENAEEKAGA